MTDDVDPALVYNTLRKAAGKEDHERALRALYAHALERGAKMAETQPSERNFGAAIASELRAEAERIMKG